MTARAWIAAAVVSAACTGCGGGGSSSAAPQSSGAPTNGGGSTPPTPPQLSITTTSLPRAVSGSPYSVQLTAANGIGALTWGGGGISGVVTVSTTGLVSGTPTQSACSFPLNVTVHDSSSPPQTASAAYSLAVAGLSRPAGNGQIGTVYSDAVDSYCLVEPVSWSLVSGSLPPGITMAPFPGEDAQLNFAGKPAQSGSFSFVIQAKDGAGLTLQQTESIRILPPPLAATDKFQQLAAVGQPFTHTPGITGGTTPYVVTVGTGSIPPGLKLDSTNGAVSGTPTTPGYYTFTLNVTDSTSPAAWNLTKSYTYLVTPAPLPPRNDTIATATPVYSATYPDAASYLASISPYTDATGTAAADEDYYVLTGNAGDTYLITATSHYLKTGTGDLSLQPSPLDPVVELLDSTGTRLATCNDPLLDSPPAGSSIIKGAANFSDPCVDHNGGPLDGISFLTIKVGGGINQKMYIHVFDFEGRARPDFLYNLDIRKQ